MTDSNAILTRDQVLTIPEQQMPMIVLSDNLYSRFAWLIRAFQQPRNHISGDYNHAMVLKRPAEVVSQNWRFGTEMLTDYLAGQYRLKIWWKPNMTNPEKARMNAKIADMLAAHGKYDWLELLGIRTGMRWLHIPGRNICSEAVAQIIQAAYPDMVKLWGNHPTPGDLNAHLDEAGWSVYGRFIPD